MKKVNISAIVVNRGELHLLESSLDSLSFCREIIVVDLDSTETCFHLASKHYAKYVALPPQPIVEIVHCKVQSIANFDWLLLIDPDETITYDLASSIIDLFSEVSTDVGEVRVPWKFFFAGKALEGTRWGGEKYKPILVNRERVHFRSVVHEGQILKKGFRRVDIAKDNQNYLRHDWISSIQDFIEKHKRYIKQEGKRKYLKGERYSIYLQIKSVLTGFYDSFIICKGYRDGGIGFILSLLWAWYLFRSWSSLKYYEKESKNINRNS